MLSWIGPTLSFETPDTDKPEVGDNIKFRCGKSVRWLLVTDVAETVTFVVLPWRPYTNKESVR